MAKLQRQELRRGTNSAPLGAGYKNRFIEECILHNLLVELTREENERTFLFRGLKFVF